jgi:hypothetical protein
MMRRRSAQLGILVVMAVVSCALPRARAENEAAPIRISLERLSLESLTSEKIQISADVGIVAQRKVTLRGVTFGQMALNGLPFYATPITEPLSLIPGQKVSPTQPILMTVYFHDLNSLRPLRSLVADEKVSLDGLAYAAVTMNAAEKMFLFTGGAQVPVRINESVELQIPGGFAAQMGALAAIDFAQKALDQAGSAMQSVQQATSEWRRQLWSSYAPALVLAHATWQFKDSAGKTFDEEATAMGFRVGGRQVVLPRSLLEPWKFDPYLAASMKEDGNLKVDHYDLWLWPEGAQLRDESGALLPAHAWRLSAGAVRVLPLAKEDNETMLVPEGEGKIMKVEVHRRQGSGALALVEITDQTVAPMAAPLALPAAGAGVPPAGQLAVFRFPGGVAAREARPDVVMVTMSASATEYALDPAIDPSGWGSPVISSQGIVGVVTHENAAVPIADAQAFLKFVGAGPPPTPKPN